MERTCSNVFLRDLSWDCSRGKSSRSVRLNLSITFRSPGAASASPGSASPERTAASLPGFSFPQEASAHKTPNKTLNEGQLVPKISGCWRWGLTATSTLCFCPRNWMAKCTTGYSATSPCTHLTRTMQLVSNNSGWTRLWWIEVWLQPESTKAQYVPPLILTGIWYPPAWSGAACGAEPGMSPPPSPDNRIDKVARVPATPAGRPRLPRHPSGGKGDKELAWRHRGNGTSRGVRAGRPLPPWRGLSRPSTPEPALPSIGAGLGEPRRHGT